jgi:hypothetical protein
MRARPALYRSQQQPSSSNHSLAAPDKPLVIEDYYCVAVKQQLHSSRRHSHSSSDDITAAAADATTIDGGNSDAVDDAADSSSTAATTTATADNATAEATKPAVKLVTALTPPRSPVYEGEDGASRWLVNTHSPPHSSSSAYGSNAAAAAGSTLQNSTMQLLQQMEACGDSDSDSDADGATANSAAGMSASVFGRYGLGRFALPKPIDIELEPVAVTGCSLGISKFAASTELQQQGGSDSLYDFTSTAAAAGAAATTATPAIGAGSASTGTTVAAAAAAAPSLVMPFMSFNQSSAGLQRAGEAPASAAASNLFSAGFTSSDVIGQQQQQPPQQQEQQQYSFEEHTQSQHEHLLLDLARSSSSSSIDSRSSSDSISDTAAGEHDLLPFGAVTGPAAATAGTTAMQQQLADIAAMDWLTGVQSDALHSSQLAQAVAASSTAGLFDGAAEGSGTAADTATAADTTVDASARLAPEYCSDPFAKLTAQLQQQQVDEAITAAAAAATSTATTAAEAAGSADKALPVACLIDTSEPASERNTAATSQQELPFAGTL